MRSPVLSGMDYRWLVACVVAFVRVAITHSLNISTIVSDPKSVPAYWDWQIGLMLATPYDYMGTSFPAIGASAWQKFYKQKAVYQAYTRPGHGKAELHNSTLAIHINGKIGKWEYTSSTNCAIMMTKPCNSFSSVNLIGTGLVPLVCGLQNTTLPAAVGNVLCNAVYKRSVAQIYPSGMLEPVQMLDSNGAVYSVEVGDVMMPMSRGDLLLSEAERFEWVTLDSSRFLDAMPSVEYVTSESVEVSMSSFKGIGKAAECQSSQLPLMLPLEGILLDGAMFYCFEVQGDIVVLTWDLSPSPLATSCGRIKEKRRFMLILYGGRTLTDPNHPVIPFQYIYTVEEAAEGVWGVTCTAQWYQDIDPFYVDNQNWDRLYFLDPSVVGAFWPNISRCAVSTLGPLHLVLSNRQLQYRAKVIKGLARDSDDAVLYPHFSTQSMGPLQGKVNVSHAFKLVPSSGPDMCMLKKVSGVPGIVGDGSFDIATETIPAMLTLGIDSGYGSQNLPMIRQQTNEMSGQFASLTMAAAVTAAMTSVVAAYSANVFTLKIKFLKATNMMRLTIRLLVSAVEAAIASVAAITGMWALYTSGKACREMQWVDSQKQTECDYEKCALYISCCNHLWQCRLLSWAVGGAGCGLIACNGIDHVPLAFCKGRLNL